MLDRQVRHPAMMAPVAVEAQPPAGGDIGLPEILAFLRRQRLPIVLTTLITLLLGGLYLLFTPAMYTAETELLIDTRRLSIFDEGNVFEDSALSTAAVETQVQLLRSGQIAMASAERLGERATDPALVGGNGGVLNIAKTFVSGLLSSIFEPDAGPVTPAGADAPSPEERAQRRAAGAILAGLKVSRDGLAYVINVSFTGRDPEIAADVANAVAAAYLEDQVTAQFTTAQRASNWLESRIEELRQQASDPSLSVQERNAVRATYDNFLQRYTQAVQQQSLPVTEARVITPAAPGYKSSPKSMLVIAGSLLFGAFLGVGIGIARDLLDRKIRTPEQAEHATGLRCFGLLPTFRFGRGTMRRTDRRARKKLDSSAHRFATGAAHSVVLNAPTSTFAETLRGAKLAAEKATHGPPLVLGIVSSLPGEGRTTVAVNLARLIAQSSQRVLLIDGDLRNPALSQSMLPTDTPGLAEAAAGESDLGSLIWSDQATPLHFLAAGAVSATPGQAPDVLASAGMTQLLHTLRQHYDFIIVDLPALLAGVEVRAAAPLFDGFLMVIEWGRVSDEMLARALHKESIEDKVIGTVLNKVEPYKVRRFESHASPYRLV